MKTLKKICLIFLPLISLLTACAETGDINNGSTSVSSTGSNNGGSGADSAVNKPEDIPTGDYAFEVQGVESRAGTIYVAVLSGNYSTDVGFTSSGEKVYNFKLSGGEGGFIGELWEPGANGSTSRTQYYGANEFYNSYYKEAVKMGLFYPFACSYEFNKNGELTQLYECVDLSGSLPPPEEYEVLYFFDYSCGIPGSSKYWNETMTFAGYGVSDEMIITGLSELTGLDFFVSVSNVDGRYTVDWSSDSTLIAGLDDREHLVSAFVSDQDSMRWFMMDSLVRTLQYNTEHEEIYFTMDGGKELCFDELYPINVIPAVSPYMGSAYYYEQENVFGNNGGTSIDEDEAMELLSAAIGLTNGMSILSYGQDIINGELCWTFAYGQDSPEKFTAIGHYAVTGEGKILMMDILDAQYKEYVAG